MQHIVLTQKEQGPFLFIRRWVGLGLRKTQFFKVGGEY